MKVTLRVLSVVISLIMLITVLASCKAPEPAKPAEDTEEIQETEENKTNPEPELPYKWLVEPGRVGGDIQPVYSVMTNDICSLGLFFWQDGSSYKLIDSEGEFKAELNTDGYGYGYCDICCGITDHLYRLNIETYAPEEYMGGHDGPDNSPLIYDVETGEIYTAYIGGYELTENVGDNVIVSLCTRQTLSEDEMIWSEQDYKYENTEGYGILVNGELKRSGYEMYSRYSNGIVAMRVDGKWGYYDAEGNEILPCEYSPSTQQLFNSLYESEYVPYQATYGIITLCRNGKWGYADINGNMLTDFVFDEARPVYRNRGWVKTAEGWGIIELDHTYSGISDEEIKDLFVEKYSPVTAPASVEQTVRLFLYETEFRVYLIDGEDKYYVTDDGHMIFVHNS